jgi:ribosome-binding ATPase YchF (GTP1/OBG family)
MTEIIQDKPDTVTILGHELVKRPFTNKELDEWSRIHDERGVDEAQKRLLALQADRQKLSNKRVELQQKAVEALEAQLDKEYEREKWDAEKIARLTGRILEESEKLAALQAEDTPRIASQSFELANEVDAAQAVTQEAHLEMCHYLATKPRPFKEWLEGATLDDYRAAREVMQAGLTPFAQRRMRKARSGNAKP